MKKAEIDAINALMNGCATAIARLWRGHRGRKKASKLRREMAEFILAIRAVEAKDDEKEFWRTHKYAKWKQNRRNIHRSK